MYLYCYSIWVQYIYYIWLYVAFLSSEWGSGVGHGQGLEQALDKGLHLKTKLGQFNL